MAKTPKSLEPLDEFVVAFLAEAVRTAGLSRRELAKASEVGVNRLGIILRGETPPASIGELSGIARALGLTASAVLDHAERAMSQADVTLAAREKDDEDENFAQQGEP